MEQPLIHKDMHVSDLLETWPSLLPFFMDKKLDCFGCSLARFCAVKDTTYAYDLELDEFILALNNFIQTQDHDK